MDISILNKELKDKSPVEIVSQILKNAIRPVVTTNFRPYEASILHVCATVKNDIPVIWCDTGYNTPQTYKHAFRTIEQLKLAVDLYVPKQTSAYRDALVGIPQVDTPEHNQFTYDVKLEPFQRAMAVHKPDVWFTNLRKGQTAFRDSLDIISQGADGVLKVSPFFHWTDEQLDVYLEKNKLENEFKYFDPTKVLSNRECGLHLATSETK
ncbi:phosphoadenosine phosphosulfate reductase family protein [Ascidiimonas sp. W6]|uniref:phosphoadenosine phosphosulfate reductase domain-containing protein n=1 Tax=Ascidiimonas meishanensis TaxID=3128903 RepID=UPI0030ED6CA4